MKKAIYIVRVTKIFMFIMQKKLTVKEFFVQDLSVPRNFELRGEAGWRIKSLKQKVGDFEFLVEDGIDCTTSTELILKTELEGIRIVIATKGRWMKTFTDTFVFETDTPGVAEFKVFIMRKEAHHKRPMREHSSEI
jgi:hypothetical protein